MKHLLDEPARNCSAGSESIEAMSQFRLQFQRSLRHCLRRRFSVEECFGLVWEETLEAVTLSDEAQAKVYDQLIEWARRGAK